MAQAFQTHGALPPHEQRQVFSRAARLLAGAGGLDPTLRQVVAGCLPGLADFGFFDALLDGGVRRTVAAHDAPDIEALLAPTGWVRQEHPQLNLCALSTGEAALHPDTDDAWYGRIAGSPEHLDLLRRLAFRSMLTVPLRWQGEVLGALTLFMGRSGRRHTDADLAFAGDLADLAAPLVAHARLLRVAEAARGRMELLAAAGEQMAHSLDPAETLQAVARTLVPGVADWCRIDLLDEAGVLQRRLAHHSDPVRGRQALAMARRLWAAKDAIGSMAWVIRHGQPHHGDFRSPEAQADPALREFTTAFGMHAHFIIPLVARGRTIGALGVVQAESGRPLEPDDRALVLELGRRAALALDNARLFAEAAAARDLAERANRAKDEFLAMLGHELRNPLAPIANALELMSRRLGGQAEGEREVIRRQVNHLSRLIDDLLDISRITRGKIELQRQPLDLRVVVAQALELTRPGFERHRAPVLVTLPEEPAMVQGDVVRLSQVLSNLLVNAAKFTPPEGLVSLHVQRAGTDWSLAVQDTGCGIAPDLLPRVFDLFVQGRQRLDRPSGGLGLGLAIVRSLVGLHGGSVDAHSEGVGRGATFTVRLPARDGAASPLPQPGSVEPAAGSGRILVVDDNVDAAQTLAELLQVLGYEARTAVDHRSALRELEAFRPQLGLLDIGLPEVDGYQLAGMVRGHPAGAGIRLVALTGYGAQSDRARALEAQFDEHLVKPVAIEKLTDVIGRLLG